jgi:hypothetical protein
VAIIFANAVAPAATHRRPRAVSSPARAIQRPIIGARSSRSLYLNRTTKERATSSQRGARPSIGRRIGNRLQRKKVGAWIVDEGNAKPRAVRLLGQRQFRPAVRAKTDAVAERLAAGWTQWRQSDIERQPLGVVWCNPLRNGARRAGAANGSFSRLADTSSFMLLRLPDVAWPHHI